MSNLESPVKLKMVKSDLLRAFTDPKGKFIDEISSCQSELDLLLEKQCEEKRKISKQFEFLKKPHLDRRSELIRIIPNFWVEAMESHPQLCLLLNDEVVEVLRYMTRIETEEPVVQETGVGFKIHFLFEENPYIENDRLTKEISIFRGNGEIRFSSTTINWKSTQKIGLHEETTSSASHGDSFKRKGKHFFTWFCDNENPDDDIFTYFQAICQNPLPYSPFFYDNSDEETEENRSCGDDHKSGVLSKEVEDLNLNDEEDQKMTVD